jgi:hypothetical protein
MSVLPVWRPSRDQAVSPWRIMKTRGVVIMGGGREGREEGGMCMWNGLGGQWYLPQWVTVEAEVEGRNERTCYVYTTLTLTLIRRRDSIGVGQA